MLLNPHLSFVPGSLSRVRFGSRSGIIKVSASWSNCSPWLRSTFVRRVHSQSIFGLTKSRVFLEVLPMRCNRFTVLLYPRRCECGLSRRIERRSILSTFIYCIRKPKRAAPKRTHAEFEGNVLVFDHLMHEYLDLPCLLSCHGGLVRDCTEAQKAGQANLVETRVNDKSGANETRGRERVRGEFRKQNRMSLQVIYIVISYSTSFYTCHELATHRHDRSELASLFWAR